jgi:hypothetical protein
MVYVPTAVEVAVANVTVEVAPVFRLAGANVAVTPVGRPLAVNVVATAGPDEIVGLATVLALRPALTVALETDRARPSVPGTETVRLYVAVWLTPFAVPVTTIG